jgi:hypothetical protein
VANGECQSTSSSMSMGSQEDQDASEGGLVREEVCQGLALAREACSVVEAALGSASPFLATTEDPMSLPIRNVPSSHNNMETSAAVPMEVDMGQKNNSSDTPHTASLPKQTGNIKNLYAKKQGKSCSTTPNSSTSQLLGTVSLAATNNFSSW